MRLRTSSFLIRTVLILLSLQFVSPTIVSGSNLQEGSHASYSFHKSATKSISFSSLFEKTEKEGEERDKLLALDLQDGYYYSYQHSIASPSALRVDLVSLHIQEPPLYRLLCTYLI